MEVNVNFKQIMQQLKELRGNVEKDMIKVIQTKGNIIRNAIEKEKFNYWLIEKSVPVKIRKDKENIIFVKNLLKKVNDKK